MKHQSFSKGANRKLKKNHCFFRIRFVCCNGKTQTNDKNKNIEFETQKKVTVRNQNKEFLLIWESP